MAYSYLPAGWRSYLRALRLRWQMARYGKFQYAGTFLFSTSKSVIYKRILTEETFEPEVVRFISVLAKQDSTVIDVGANIGSVAADILFRRPDVYVVSVECSPSTLPKLRETISNSIYRNRWRLIECAAYDHNGVTAFHTHGGDNGAFDGIKDTRRAGRTTRIEVDARTLDDIWRDLGKPEVSIIKLDIEGGESRALKGSENLLSACSPTVIFEWNESNLRAYELLSSDIFDLIPEGYQLISIPSLRIVQRSLLQLEMSETEMFALIPKQK